MKIVIIGNADSHWTYELSERVFAPRGDVITILTFNNTKYKFWYDSNGIKVITTRKEGLFSSKIPGIRTVISLLRLRSCVKKTEMDVGICIYPSWILMLFLGGLKQIQKFIFYFIGSDLLRTNKRLLLMSRRLVSKLRDIVVITKEMHEKLYDIYGSSIKGNVHVLDFGVSHFEDIGELKEEKDECKINICGAEFSNRNVITIGYNAQSSQQVDKVLERLSLFSEQDKSQMFLLIPMQYGSATKKYMNDVSTMAEKSGIPYKILSEYYDGRKMAEFLKATDIFINAQVTDAISAAVLEHLYSQSLVISGEWLKYSILDDNKVVYFKFPSFSELDAVLKEIMGNKEKYQRQSESNPSILYREWSWKRCADSWDSILHDYE